MMTEDTGRIHEFCKMLNYVSTSCQMAFSEDKNIQV